MGWIADFFRLAWGFLYWNTRKTVYRLRRSDGGRCPCQHPSDSGRARETACAAVASWNNPARFQRLCPLLQRTEAGVWRCSVDRADVRPFWGRASVFYGTAIAILYLSAALAAFTFFRSVGYRVTYPGVLWPPAWKKISSIRSEFFLQKYQSASHAGDTQSALMALSTAYGLDPHNYSAGRQLASLWQVNQPGHSDQIYQRLLNEHPDRAEATAQAWFRALLARGNYAGVETLAAARITAEPDGSSAWLNALLFANARTGNAAVLADLVRHPALPPASHFLLTLHADLKKAAPDALRPRLLTAAADAPDAASFYQVCRQLIARGCAQDALGWLERRPGLLGPRDLLPLRLDALAAAGWHTTLRSEVEGLLIPEPEAILMELFGAHLIRHPDADVRNAVFARLERDPLPDTPANYPAYLSLFCAAGVARDTPRMHWTAAHIKAILHDDFRSLDVIGEALLDNNRRHRVENVLPALQPLPLEVSYALLEHYAPAP